MNIGESHVENKEYHLIISPRLKVKELQKIEKVLTELGYRVLGSGNWYDDDWNNFIDCIDFEGRKKHGK